MEQYEMYIDKSSNGLCFEAEKETAIFFENENKFFVPKFDSNTRHSKKGFGIIEMEDGTIVTERNGVIQGVYQ